MRADATDVAAYAVHVTGTTGVKSSSSLGRLGSMAGRPLYIIPAIVAGLVIGLIPSAWSELQARRAAAFAENAAQIELVASLAAFELTRLAGVEMPTRSHLTTTARKLAVSAVAPRRTIVLSDEYGTVISAEPPLASPARTLGDLLREAQPLTIQPPTMMAETAGATRVTLPDGGQAVAAVRNLARGQVSVLQSVDDMRGAYQPWSLGHTLVTLLAGFGLAGLGAGCSVHARRARAAHRHGVRTARRLDLSLTRGRCGLWDWDIGRGRVYWSSSLYEILGYERRDEYLSFGEIGAIIHPADGDLFAFAKGIAADTGHHLDHEFRIRTAAGAWLWMRARADVTTDPEDGGRHVVGIMVDISAEHGLAERSAAADLRLRDAVEAISEAFVLWDPDNRLVLCNSKFRRLHDLSAEIVRPGARYAEIMEASRPPVVTNQLMRENAEEPGGRTMEAQLADGRWLQINERRTKDGGFVSVGTDVTNLKRHEEKLLDQEGRLIATIRDLRRSRQALEIRTHELADLAERYHEQTAQAESANRAKTEFLAKMSHELRTPLNAIIGFAEVMNQQMFGPLGSERYVDYCGHVRTSGIHLLGIINDILQMSRIEAGHISLTSVPVSLEHLLDRVIAAQRGEAEGKALTVLHRIEGRDTVLADHQALHQVMSQLVENAVKFARRGGTVRLRVKPALGSVNIFVEDDGIGIPAEFLPKLGRPFEQVETEFCRSGRGSGLGLAIARALIEMHGGRLRIRSQEGTGTVVLVHLPLGGPPEPDATALRAAA